MQNRCQIFLLNEAPHVQTILPQTLAVDIFWPKWLIRCVSAIMYSKRVDFSEDQSRLLQLWRDRAAMPSRTTRIKWGKVKTVLLIVAFAICATSKIIAAEPPDFKLLQLAKEHFTDLTPGEERLFSATALGTNADFTVGSTTEDNPTNAMSWQTNRVIRADRFVWLCTDPSASALVTYHGIQIQGVRIDGDIDLAFANISFPLNIQRSAIIKAILLNHAKLRSLVLTGTSLQSLGADGIQVEANVDLNDGFRSVGDISFFGADVIGNLDCDGGTFLRGITIDDAKVGNNVFLGRGFEASNEVSFAGATIGGDLNCDGGRIYGMNLDKTALLLVRTKIGGSVFLRNSFTSGGEITLSDSTIGGMFDCDGETNSGITADSAKINGDVLLRYSFNAGSEVSFIGAVIGGDLDCDGGRFLGNDTNQRALTVIRARIDGRVFLGDGFKAEGKVRFIGSTLGGFLKCINGMFSSDFDVENAKIDNGVFLCDGFMSNGEVDFSGVNITGDLDCRGGQFLDESTNDDAFDLSSAKLDGVVLLSDGFCTEGDVKVSGSVITKNLNCENGRFRSAFFAENVKIGGDALLRDGFSVEGEVDFLGASIGGDLDCEAGQFFYSSPNNNALDVSGARVEGNLFLSDGFTSVGDVALLDSTINGDFNCKRGDFNSNLTANNTKISGDVDLNDGFSANGVVSLVGAAIDNTLGCRTHRFSKDLNQFPPLSGV
jgi:hypothetical protein